MHVLLHIGTHKTGTTSIQDTLRASSGALLQNGILYPEAGCPPGLSGQHMLAWAVRADKEHKLPSPPPPVWDTLLDEIQDVQPRRVILSAEAFEGASLAEVEAIKAKLKGYSLSALLYLRSPMAYLRSAYKQQVKMGTCRTSFVRFMDEHAADVDYESLVRRWAKVLGADNISVRVFEEAVKRGLLNDFSAVAGIEKGLLRQKVHSNVSPPDEVIRIVRYLNATERWAQSIGQSHSSTRGFFERVRRRLLRGGYTARWLTAISRILGLRALDTSDDADRLRRILEITREGYLEKFLTGNERALLSI